MQISPVKKEILVLILLLVWTQSAVPANILSVTFMSSKSHKITYAPLLEELAKRGHSVTVLSPIPESTPVLNVREILTLNVAEAMCQMPNLYEMRERGDALNPIKMYEKYYDLCSETYDLPQVKKIMKESFDLVILTPIFNECVAGFVHMFHAPLILMVPVSAPSWITSIFGNAPLTSFIPNMFTSYTHRMTFYERTLNFLADGITMTILNFRLKPRMEALYRHKLNDPSLPSSDAVFGNASLILSNSHFSLTHPRPLLPDIVEVGGMHCRPGRSLPKELDTFVNSSSEGVIYFSMGSALKGARMPKKYQLLFMNAFAQLKYKVVWKWEIGSMDDLPSNVKLSDWLPQQDLLAHPNVKLFITHGGFGSITEAVYHGVPIIGIPLFGDQYLNMKHAESSGYGLTLEFSQLTEETLVVAINRVLDNPIFEERMKFKSKILRDQPETPLMRAVYWTEYILRHNGAPHLRSAARELNIFQYHSIDVVFTLSILVFMLLYVVYKVGVSIIRKFSTSIENKTVKGNKVE